MIFDREIQYILNEHFISNTKNLTNYIERVSTFSKLYYKSLLNSKYDYLGQTDIIFSKML